MEKKRLTGTLLCLLSVIGMWAEEKPSNGMYAINQAPSSYSSISSLLSESDSMENGVTVTFNGEAIVSYIEGQNVFLSDNTGSAVLLGESKAIDGTPLHAGDVVYFTANVKKQDGYVAFEEASFSRVYSFNWRTPLREKVSTISGTAYGKYVILENVRLNDFQMYTDNQSVRRYYFGYTDKSGYTFRVQPKSEDNAYYGEYPYDYNTDVDVIGVVMPFEWENSDVKECVVPVKIRKHTPDFTITEGDYMMSGKSIIYKEVINWTCSISRDDDDPYVYWFSRIAEPLNGVCLPVYGILSDDGKTISFPMGQDITGESGTSDGSNDVFFGAFNNFDQSSYPFAKGEYLIADIDEDGVIIVRNDYGIVCHNRWAEDHPLRDTLLYGLQGAFYAGTTMTHITPMPVVTDWDVTAEGTSVTVTWQAPVTMAGYNIIGYRIYCNGNTAMECAPDTFTWTQTNLRDGNYEYAISVIYEEGESELSETKTVTIDLSGVESIDAESDDFAKIYGIDGKYIGTLSDSMISSLASGIYVVKDGAKVRKIYVK